MAGKAKQVSLDAAFKALLKEFGIPGKKEIDRLSAKLDRLEKILKKTPAMTTKKAAPPPAAKTTGARRLSATNSVLESIKKSKKGADFATLQNKTDFDEKKLRNIIYRLHKLGKIKRVSRGLYESIE